MLGSFPAQGIRMQMYADAFYVSEEGSDTVFNLNHLSLN